MRPGQLDALAEAAAEVVFPAGHRIFDEGDNADHFWLIQSGYVVLDVQVPGEGHQARHQVHALNWRILGAHEH